MTEKRNRTFLRPNIDRSGRIARAVSGFVFLLAGAASMSFAWPSTPTVRYALWGILFGSGLFQLFEAKRGWCVMRACGVRTPM